MKGTCVKPADACRRAVCGARALLIFYVADSYKLNICGSIPVTTTYFALIKPAYVLYCIPGDVGGQRTLRSYWKNYYEKTDALIWVVDATDRLRVDDCRAELAGLLLEEVSDLPPPASYYLV